MTLRNYALIGFSGLCILTAVAGYTAEQEDASPIEFKRAHAAVPSCMLDGFDTPEGRVGCFEPVIAVVDGNFFETNAVVVDEDAAE